MAHSGAVKIYADDSGVGDFPRRVHFYISFGKLDLEEQVFDWSEFRRELFDDIDGVLAPMGCCVDRTLSRWRDLLDADGGVVEDRILTYCGALGSDDVSFQRLVDWSERVMSL